MCLQPPDKVQLHKQLANGAYEQLDDAKKLADLKVENDGVVAMCYMQEGEQLRGLQHAKGVRVMSATHAPHGLLS